jgi:drug/metabolite transporter (DMT)-like permease
MATSSTSAPSAPAAASAAAKPAVSAAPLASVAWPARWLTLACIWGLSFLFIKVGIGSFAPLQVAALRLAFGALTLLALVRLTHDHLPRARRTWLHLVIGTVFMNVLPFTLFAYGEQRVSSVLAGIWNSTTPLLAVPFVILLVPNERLSATRLGGLVVGFLGVLVVLGVWNGLGEHDLAADLMCLGAAACYGLGFPYARRFLALTGDSPTALAAAQVTVGTVEAGILAIVLTGPPATIQVDAVLAVLALGALGTGIAYVLNWSILRDVGATAATMVTYALPVVAVVAGVVFLGESLTWNEPVGAAIIVLGALLTQGQVGRVRAVVGRRLRPRTISA